MQQQSVFTEADMRIGDLVQKAEKPFFSLEFFPPAKTGQLPAFYQTVDELAALEPLFVSVTYGAGGGKQRNTLDVTAELARKGLNVMAHLTCVGAEPGAIREFLSALAQNGVNNVLALRGDPPKDREWSWQTGPFRYASDLVEFVKREFPAMGVAVAAYPAPHPESPTFAEDRANTARKLATGADFAVSQLFFDVREYIELMRSLAEKGIKAPVIPGIMAIQSLESLKRVLSLCGANIPGNLYLELEAANASGGAEAVREAGIAFATRQIRQLLDAGAPGIHLYTLNKSGVCSRIVQECGLA